MANTVAVDDIEFVLNNTSMPLLVLDSETRIRKSNQAWLVLVGEKNHSAVHNKNYTEILESLVKHGIYTSEVKEEVVSALKRFAKGKSKIFRSEFKVRDRWYVSNLQPIYNGDKYEGVAIAHNDITDWKKRESSLKEESLRSLESSKRQTMFLANLNHELKTPLNAIVGFAQLLKEQLQQDSKLGDYGPMFENIYEGATHLDSIVSRILQMAKIQSGTLILHEDRIMPQRLVQFSINMVSAVFPGREITTTFCEDALKETLKCDKHLVIEVLMNLIVNALKYSKDNIVVECAMDPQRNLQFVVTDTGPGMSEDEIAIAMQPFGQNKHSSSERLDGLGLGLPFAYNIMKLHNGDLRVSSVKGKGTCVTVMFPSERIRI